MHIHDADTALWWFGEPDKIEADGISLIGAPNQIDATWHYNNGPVVTLHGAWDNNGGDFDFGFKVVLEKATILHHPGLGVSTLQIVKGDKDGDTSEEIELTDDMAYHW